MRSDQRQGVLVLGAGINGCAVARELVLNGVPVWLVDVNDLSAGATSRSSRLIHGGLRYLEYGDLKLVRESLEERSRLRRLAPQFVAPLRLYVPVRRRAGGLAQAAFRFLRACRSRLLRRLAGPRQPSERGLWVVRTGLWLYDRVVRDAEFPPARVEPAGAPHVPRVDPREFRWLCSYSDAQMLYPERFVVALVEDARQAAARAGVAFRVLTYHRAALRNGAIELRRHGSEAVVHELTPAVIVNATGAWGDLTLGDLRIRARPLFGGTKGSHIVTHHRVLREALGEGGVYAEAADGRLVFVLPFGESVLVGTTDVRFDGPPGSAVASPEEVDYLLGMVNGLFPDARLTRQDVDLHYSGVRPLPHSGLDTTGAITRDHEIHVHEAAVPVLTLVGGKLTTCRSFAAEVADRVLARLGRERTAETLHRPLPGGAHYPPDRKALEHEWQALATAYGATPAQVRALWALCGNQAAELFAELPGPFSERLTGTELPLAYVRWVVRQEWVTTLDDLIERRLMLLFHPELSELCVRQLADCLVEAGLLECSRVDAAVRNTTDRLRQHYGKRLAP